MPDHLSPGRTSDSTDSATTAAVREVSGWVKGGTKRNRSMLTAAAYRITTSRPTSVYQFNPAKNSSRILFTSSGFSR